ncbi:3-methyl-2-oxobutanoate hydroxymethyltransferase [Legionella sp. CNM-4043-24]|uniref:3-methyl-2-oxobutanoate hydroxymethyltransferase n=1 Tax=Legionella sp. CNM-4043-24 TaxID=3421646 RepID=UPI00403A8410
MKITDFLRKKQQGEKITMLTCYDYPSARIVAESHLDCVLVGDSVAMAVHGHDSTIMANMDMMTLHTAAVARGIKQQLIISDLPFLCHRVSQADTINNVRRLLQAGAQAVKMEGGDADTCQTIAYLVNSGVPVIGHIGLMPQSICQLGTYKVQGKNDADAASLLYQAQQLEKSGCSAVVMECVPESVAGRISKALQIPVIGIGAGASTDGQVLVWHDMLGLQDEFKPKFLKQYAQGKGLLLEAINAYVQQVRASQFPALEHTF